MLPAASVHAATEPCCTSLVAVEATHHHFPSGATGGGGGALRQQQVCFGAVLFSGVLCLTHHENPS